MAKQYVVVLLSLLVVLATVPALAQDEAETEEKVFNLIVGEEAIEEEEDEEAVEPVYEPAIEPGEWAVTLTLGYFGVSGTLLEHENLIYKATDDAFFYGDIDIEAEAAFNPILRGSYNLTTWLALEAQMGITFAEYEATISDPYSVDPEETGSPSPVFEIGEFDPERRSVLMAIGNLNGLFYPFNLDGDGKGRWHPYLTGGLGYAIYNLDSDYTTGSSSSVNVNLGAGLTLIADDIISVRAEILYQVHTIELDPADTFQERNAGTEIIPVYEFTDFGQFDRVQEFGSNSLSGLTWQLGFSLRI
ncbi:hypothetical protein GF314_12740 [bacterium]|nr:hypothetical protein [bacterium]